jgi:hypothetical protein
MHPDASATFGSVDNAPNQASSVVPLSAQIPTARYPSASALDVSRTTGGSRTERVAPRLPSLRKMATWWTPPCRQPSAAVCPAEPRRPRCARQYRPRRWPIPVGCLHHKRAWIKHPLDKVPCAPCTIDARNTRTAWRRSSTTRLTKCHPRRAPLLPRNTRTAWRLSSSTDSPASLLAPLPFARVLQLAAVAEARALTLDDRRIETRRPFKAPPGLFPSAPPEIRCPPAGSNRQPSD